MPLSFKTLFSVATGGRSPYEYQSRLACGERDGKTEDIWLCSGVKCGSQLINIPTGLGKTAAVVLAWLWNRAIRKDPEWPRRLVYCLPMRTLVEQTEAEVKRWISAILADEKGELGLDDQTKAVLKWMEKNGPVILMGGEDDGEWDIYPEREAILIGTQDMLLSRALNRGYGISRFRWPMHFGLLNNDALWVMDETQLMGPGLWTSGQLDWMRNYRFGVVKPCATWWMSATNSPAFLDTLDRQKESISSPPIVRIGDDPNALSRLNPRRPLYFWKNAPPKIKSKKKNAPTPTFSESLASAIRDNHAVGTLSLVVCNSVRVAQELYSRFTNDAVILLTSRFRREDRNENIKRLLDFERQRKTHNQGLGLDTVPDSPGLICISTQVIEAGVDISARRLWMEAAPWPSALQRLGRLNRDGRSDEDAKAFVFVWPEEGKKGKRQASGPYELKELEASTKLLLRLVEIYEKDQALGVADALTRLRESSAAEIDFALKPKNEPFPRAIDIHGLFTSEPDAFGGFTDVSHWIRGSDKSADVTVFWREFDQRKGPGKGEALTGPSYHASEGCQVAIHRFREFLDTDLALVWDERSEQWQPIWANELCPGMVVMLPRSAGGYSEKLGWTGRTDDKPKTAMPPGVFIDSFDQDTASEQADWFTLQTHLNDTKSAAERILSFVHLDDAYRTAVVAAAELHDIGKAHPVWQNSLPTIGAMKEILWAKAPFVFVLSGKESGRYRESTERLLAESNIKSCYYREEKPMHGHPRQLWTVDKKIQDDCPLGLLMKIVGQDAGLKGYMRRFLPRPSADKPSIRHEAASALAAWTHYFVRGAQWPGLTLFLIACHHGKVRTVLYARGADGEDVCGVPKQSEILPWADGIPMSFSCASVGASGDFSEDGLTFVPTSPSWTGLISDLLGGWGPRSQSPPSSIALRSDAEPRWLGPFRLAYLESLVRASDIQASKEHPFVGPSSCR